MRIQQLVLALRKTSQVLMVALACAIAVAAQGAPANAPAQDDGWFSTVFSFYGITALLLLALVGLFLVKKIRAKHDGWEEVEEEPKKTRQPQRNEHPHRNEVAHADEEAGSQMRQTAQHWDRPAQLDTDAVFGAYRVDQEVGKLILGKAHRTDVMSSRVLDDRRAIESSLVKALGSPDTNEEGQRRARQALEEYGFLARQSAILLLGRDTWERSSAARMLGQVGSPSSLPYLIEALHDPDVVVRNQAVASLGALKLPAAIGALLDISRRHPDIPAPLLSEALSSCSLASTEFFDFPATEPVLHSDTGLREEPAQSEHLAAFNDLPEGSEDASLLDALSQLSSDDERVRAQAAQMLASHPVQCSVSALASLTINDSDAGVRAAAVASLGSIDHESVFAPVLIALADESREVQAAAARALTSLRFDRGDAYVRVMETADPQTLHNVARACVKIGIVAQAIDRLASEDRRQAYEAFSLFSLLARANENGTLLTAIETHPDENVRLSAVRVLSVAAQPGIASKLRELVAGESISENLRTAILEVLYKLDQEPPVTGLVTGDNVTSDVA